MNNRGEVVWMGHDEPDREIFLYDGASILQLTDNDSPEYTPEISDNGTVIWSGDGIWLYDGVDTMKIAESGSSAQVNVRDEVVYSSRVGGDDEIFLFDGTITTQLTNNDRDDVLPGLNDAGHVVWRGATSIYDDGWRRLYLHEIFRYDGSGTTELSEYFSSFCPACGAQYGPKISADGKVAWGGHDLPPEYDWEIYLALP
jgi:hypothetical protein